MLLNFQTANHLSLRDASEISLIASNLKDDTHGLINPDGIKFSVLPVAIVYGGNASGKSNLLNAISFMISTILLSHGRSLPETRIPRRPFALDRDSRRLPSRFEIGFLIDATRYHYEFECNDECFTKECLYSFPAGRKQTLFERNYQDFRFGRALKGRNRIISELTRPNSLFLSAAAQNDHDEISRIYRFFSKVYLNTNLFSDGTIESFELRDEELDDRVIRFLDSIGTGVVAYRKEEEEFSDEMKEFQRGIYELLRRTKLSSGEPEPPSETKDLRFELGHRGEDGEIRFLDFRSESSGTRRLLFLLRKVFDVLDNGGLVFVDELDASLHTQACEAVIALFSSPATNPHGAQIVATTHDTNLLASGLIRRDQIWLCEKEPNGISRIFPLTDFHTRKQDNLEKGYLQGRFGGTPISGSPVNFVQMWRRN